jgi:hypothetical protein
LNVRDAAEQLWNEASWSGRETLPVVLDGDDVNLLRRHHVDDTERSFQQFAKIRIRVLRESSTHQWESRELA